MIHTLLLHETYDALLDIQKMTGVIVAPTLLRKLYEAIAAPPTCQPAQTLCRRCDNDVSKCDGAFGAAQPATQEPRLRAALSGLLEYCAENNPMQGDDERDDPRVKEAFRALAAQPAAQEPSK